MVSALKKVPVLFSHGGGGALLPHRMTTTHTAFPTCASIGPSTKPFTSSSSSRERAVWRTHVCDGPDRGAVTSFPRPSKAATPTVHVLVD
jgi:hypothetical protein